MLRPRKRISRREIKEDALVTAYFRVQKFLQTHSKKLNVVFAGVVLIVVVGLFMARSKKKAESIAAGKLGIVEQFYYASQYNRAIDELKQIVDTYSGTRAAGTAAFFLANSYFATADYENAEKYYEIYLDDYSDSKSFSASSLSGMAACLEYQGQYSEAARLYEKAGNKFHDSYTAPFYLNDAGRCYVIAGDKEKGREMYRAIMEQYSESSLTQEVAVLLETL